MASIIDSFREVLGDRLAFLKIVLLAIPVNYTYSLYVGSNGDFAKYSWMLYLTLFLLFGMLVKITNNVANEKECIFPSFNPLSFLLDTFKGILAILPAALICYWIASYFCSLINIIPWLDITLKSIIWLVVVAIVVTSFLMFTTNKKILEAYNVKMIFDKAGDLIVTLIFFVIQAVVINVPTAAFIGYTLLILFGFGPIFDFYVCFAIVFNIGVMGHYLGQVHYETITYAKSNKI